jgi:NhaC family Na+:H+ antiporter
VIWNLLNYKMIFALLAGLCILVGLAKTRSYSFSQVFGMCFRGVKMTRGLLILFVLVGVLTSLWRACGTIPVIVSWAANLIHPQSFILVTFLLNAAMSLLTGTSLGTAATMGVICATSAQSLDICPMWTGGAILSGAYFGNRISPISSMALLTANISETDIYQNVRNMLKTTWLPLLLSCAVYLVAGFVLDESNRNVFSAENVHALFLLKFSLSWWGFVPAVLMIVLSALRWRSSLVLLFSAVAAILIALFVENCMLSEVLKTLVYGYRANVPELNRMVNGGGVLSMVNVFIIVVIAGCYGGIFKETGLLNGLKSKIQRLECCTNSFVAMLVTSVLMACMTCNQTLTIILTHQLTSPSKPLPKEREWHALNLYDSAVTVIALVPWSVATTIVLVAAQAPLSSVFCACFLYLLPITRLVLPLKAGRK